MRPPTGLKLRVVTLDYLGIGHLAALKAASLPQLETLELKSGWHIREQPLREVQLVTAFAAELAQLPRLSNLYLQLATPLSEPVDFKLPHVEGCVFSGQFAPVIDAPTAQWLDVHRLDDDEDHFTDFTRSLMRSVIPC